MQMRIRGKDCMILIIYHSITGYSDSKDTVTYEGGVFIKWE
jgi:hypothetical protein